MYYLFDSMSNNDQLPSNFEYFLPTKLFAQAWFHLLKAKLYKSISITNFFSLYQKLRDMPIYPTQIENVRGIFEKKSFFSGNPFSFLPGFILLYSIAFVSHIFENCFSKVVILFYKLFLLSVFLYFYLSVYLSIHQSFSPSFHSLAFLSVFISVCLSVHPSTRSTIPLSFLSFFHLSVCSSVWLSVCLS